MTTVTTLSSAASNFLNLFDGAVDEFCSKGKKFDVDQFFAQIKLRDTDLIAIQTKLQKTTDELELLVIDADEQITEGYSNLSKAQQRELLAIYHSVMERVPSKSRARKQKSDGVIRVPAKEEKKVETYNTVFTFCDKYKAVRVFKGNVKITGNKAQADEIYQIRMSKKDDLLSMKNATEQEVFDFISSGKKTDRTPTTLSGDTIDFILKF